MAIDCQIFSELFTRSRLHQKFKTDWKLFFPWNLVSTLWKWQKALHKFEDACPTGMKVVHTCIIHRQCLYFLWSYWICLNRRNLSTYLIWMERYKKALNHFFRKKELILFIRPAFTLKCLRFYLCCLKSFYIVWVFASISHLFSLNIVGTET